MTQPAVDGCGDPSHSPDCTCDVIVAEKAPVRFPLGRVWFADIIARAHGIDPDNPRSRAEFVDFVVDLTNAYDALHRVRGQGMHRVFHFKAKRAELATYLREGGKLSEVGARTGLEWHDVINILTQAKPSRLWLWPLDEWDRFEKAIRNAPRPNRQIARDFDLSTSTVWRFWDLYHGPPI